MKKQRSQQRPAGKASDGMMVGHARGVVTCACGFASASSAVMAAHVEDCPELRPVPAASVPWRRRAAQWAAGLFA